VWAPFPKRECRHPCRINPARRTILRSGTALTAREFGGRRASRQDDSRRAFRAGRLGRLSVCILADGTSATETRWTFAEIARNSSAFAARLSSHGVGVSDRVVLAVNPGLAYIAALYGIMQLGAVPVPCFPPLRPKELHRFRAISFDSAAAAIVIDEMYRQPMRELQSQLRACELAPAVLYVSELPADATASVNPRAFSPADLALIQYTSGSTGAPKGVCLTQGKPDEQLRSPGPEHGRGLGPCRLLMAAAVSRHGTDGNDFRVDVPGCPTGPDVADALRSGPSPMAESHQRLQSVDHCRTELFARHVFRCFEPRRD